MRGGGWKEMERGDGRGGEREGGWCEGVGDEELW